MRIPLVKPPRFASGGGAEMPNRGLGGSGHPGMPQPGSQRARDLAVAYADDERGRFTERVFRWPDFGVVFAGTSSAPQSIQISSNRTSFVRMVALRGGIKKASVALTGFELANLRLRLQINGEEDLTTTGQATLPVEFDGLFGPTINPVWFWFACPPRVRVSDQMQATITNDFPAGEGEQDLTPYLLARFVDDEWWRELYGT